MCRKGLSSAKHCDVAGGTRNGCVLGLVGFSGFLFFLLPLSSSSGYGRTLGVISL